MLHREKDVLKLLKYVKTHMINTFSIKSYPPFLFNSNGGLNEPLALANGLLGVTSAGFKDIYEFSSQRSDFKEFS